ncbi:hypothetical protein RZS08_33885, partial [Arthrospira platensis SPKY1]|nr:hypothetical protein [Arthrospira platensis SPKY1]
NTAPADSDDSLSEIMGMDNEALTTLIVDNPKEFTKLIAEKVKEHAVREAVRQAQEETTKTSAISEFRKVVDSYEKENPDFRRMWDSGEIKRFMNDHPYHGYNAITAHKAITEKARIEAAQAAAEAKALEKAKKTQEGKEGLRTV